MRSPAALFAGGRMTVVYETIENNRSIYTMEDDGTETIFRYPTRIITPPGIKKTYLLFNDDMQILPASIFITYQMGDWLTDSMRDTALSALRLFHIFCAICQTEPNDLCNSQCDQLLTFLKGENIEGTLINFMFLRNRSSETVNIYLSQIRAYLNYLHAPETHPLFSTNLSLSGLGFSIYRRNSHAKYKKHLSTNKPQQRAPVYITVEQFSRLLDVIQNSDEADIWKEEAILIISLMYYYGLRLGEVLSLTLEDLELTSYPPTYDGMVYDHDTGEMYVAFEDCGKLTLRNRRNAHIGSRCKRLLQVKSINTYTSKDYNTQGIGYSEVLISLSLYQSLLDYYDESEVLFRGHGYQQYENATVDSVAFYQLPAERRHQIEKIPAELSKYRNRYLFLNQNGGQLIYKTWNKRLKTYFIEAEIPLDTGKKTQGLSHRFRHAFAMNFIKMHQKQDPIDVQYKLMRAMRHTSILSVEPYFTPTTAEILQTLEAVDLTPDLSIDALEKIRKGGLDE